MTLLESDLCEMKYWGMAICNASHFVLFSGLENLEETQDWEPSFSCTFCTARSKQVTQVCIFLLGVSPIFL